MSYVLLLVGVLFLVPESGGQGTLQSSTDSSVSKRRNPAALMKYVGRYQLEVGLIPISTLDVTIENDELWIKPSGIKKHRLQQKGKAVFIDELAGTPCTFSKDENGKVVSLTFVYEGADYIAQRVVLPAASLKGNTTFKLKGYPDANLVVLAGTFNNWNQSQFVFGREGDEWVCRIDLEPGKHAYKFIVDGNWILDPGNAVTEEDAAGNVNSILVVAKDKN